jgi:hypothetical protein
MQNEDSKMPPDDARPLSRHEVALDFLTASIKKDLAEHPPEAHYDPSSCFYTLLLDLEASDPEWPSHKTHLIFGLGTGIYQREGDQIIRKKAEKERPTLLARKGFERVKAIVMVDGRPVAIGNATADQKRESTKKLARLVDTYKRPRVSPEKLKEHETRLSQEKKFDRKVIPLTGGDKQMELFGAMEKLEAKLEAPHKAINARWDRKKARTKNQ